ncbi:flagella basal body P-ring formation protein FlgA [bacterium]|nr:flagella basal body P-ring formation protein FlgA [bacterium]MCB2179428.1 flagella basal body P-ring formation protein FlgA [bacterium]
MRLGRLLLLVALVAVVGIGAIFIISQQGGGGLSDVDVAATEAALQTIPVVTLKQPVSRGEVISEAKLEIKNLPITQVAEGSSYNAISAVVGKVARIDLPSGTFLNESMILENVEESDGSDHSWLIPEGMVAFPVPINRFSSVAYGLTRGDRVDVIVTMAFVDLDTQFQSITPNQTAGVLSPGSNILIQEAGSVLTGENFSNLTAQTGTGGTMSPQGRAELDALLEQVFYYVPSESQRPRVVSQMIMQNLPVLNVGTFPVYNNEGQEVVLVTPTPQGYVPPEDGEQPVTTVAADLPPDVVTLIMWPQDAVTLNYLLYTGAELTLALRASGDESRVDTDAVTLQYLMDVYRIPLPTRLPYGTLERIDQLLSPVLENDQNAQ